MSGPHKRKIKAARVTADALADGGNQFAANVVRELCRSSEQSMAVNSQLHLDNVQLRARVEALRSQIVFAYDTLVEINISNYDHDDVCRQNDAVVEVILALKETKTMKEADA